MAAIVGSDVILVWKRTIKNDYLNLTLKCLQECAVKAGLYRIWCGMHRLGDSGVHTLSDTSAFVNPVVQLLLIAINSGLIAEWMASG